MLFRRRVHAGHVYLGKEILDTLGIKDGDEVELEVKEGEVIVGPVKVIDNDTLELIRLLRKVKVGDN